MKREYIYIAQEPPVLFRIAAFVVDSFLKGVLFQIGLIISSVINVLYFKEYVPTGELVLLIFLSASIAYNGLWYYFFEATPGKMIFKLKVKMMDGKRIGFIIGGLRDSFVHPLSAVFCISYIVGACRNDQRCLHDLIVGSRLVWFEKVYQDEQGEDK